MEEVVRLVERGGKDIQVLYEPPPAPPGPAPVSAPLEKKRSREEDEGARGDEEMDEGAARYVFLFLQFGFRAR